MTVPNCVRVLALLLLGGIVSGCGSSRPRQFVQAHDWQSEDALPTPVPITRAAVPTNAPPDKPQPKPSISQPAAPVPTKARTETSWVALNRWCRENGYAAPTCLGLAPLPNYAIAAPKGPLIIHAKNQSAQWAGLELRLAFAPVMINGEPYIHALDLEKTIKPILSNGKLNLRDSSPVIVIDPGHGGENAGAKSVLGNRYEKEFTLDWGRRLASLLSSNGWHVFLTRTNDSDLALSNRVACADEHKADLFLSLHFNSAAPNEAEAGLETYCLTPIGAPSTVTRGFSDDPSEGFPNNAFDIQNFQFALQVHRALLQVDGRRDRGVRRARFPGVLQRQQRPAILVEGGYLSNPGEARLIAESGYRQKLAEATANALESLLPKVEKAETGVHGTALKTSDAL